MTCFCAEQGFRQGFLNYLVPGTTRTGRGGAKQTPCVNWCGAVFALISLTGIVLMGTGIANILQDPKQAANLWATIITDVGAGLLGGSTCVVMVHNIKSFHEMCQPANRKTAEACGKPYPLKTTFIRVISGVLLLGGISATLAGVHCGCGPMLTAGSTAQVTAGLTAGVTAGPMLTAGIIYCGLGSMAPGVFYQLIYPLHCFLKVRKKMLQRGVCLSIYFW